MSLSTATLIAVTAALISAALVALLRPWLGRYFMAYPNLRSSHTRATPQGGGIAVVIATTAATILYYVLFASPESKFLNDIVPLLCATILIAMVGAIDDLSNLGVGPRLLAQAVAVGLVLATMPIDVRLVPLLPVWAEYLLLLLCGIWFVNIVNFMDGIDCITVAESIPLSCCVGVLGIWTGMPNSIVVISFALTGALIGFAPFNRPVAKVFLGDVGSLPIGLLMAWMLLLVALHARPAAAVLLPMYYVADATITLLARLVRKQRVWQAHREHFYQRATRGGYSVCETVRLIFISNLMLAALSLLTVYIATEWFDIIAVAVGAVLVTVLLCRFHRGKR